MATTVLTLLTGSMLCAGTSTATSAKNVNVTYNQTGICKSLVVPLIAEEYQFGTDLTDKIWKKAARGSDFFRYPFRADGEAIRPSEFYVFRTAQDFVCGWFFTAPEAEQQLPQNSGDYAIWSGDCAELHFGAIAPDAWHLQLVGGISGLWWDSAGLQECVEYKPFRNADGWGAELRLPLAKLRLAEGGMYFNICRNAPKTKTLSCWNPLQTKFHEVENFGELLFDSYEKVCELRTGIAGKPGMTQAEFEAARRTWETPATAITHGPYLSNPSDTSLCINWSTAGLVPAFAEYRKRGSQEAFKRVYSNFTNGTLPSETNHFAALENLAPDTEYEYALFALSPVNNTVTDSAVRGTFKTPAPAADFAFFCITDLHSNVQYLKQALQAPEAGRSAFGILLGDNLSHCTGCESLYQGVIDPVLAVRRDWPLAFVRGNHEFRGLFTKDYYTVMRHLSGKTWYAFRYGNVFFTVLDSGEDHEESEADLTYSNTMLRNAQRQWLETVAASPAYRNAAFRVVLVHIPPLAKTEGTWKMLEPLATAAVLPDLMLSGHWHQYACLPANTKAYTKATEARFQAKAPAPEAYPCCRLVLSTDTFLFAEKVGDTLKLSVIRQNPDNTRSVVETLEIPAQKH